MENYETNAMRYEFENSKSFLLDLLNNNAFGLFDLSILRVCACLLLDSSKKVSWTIKEFLDELKNKIQK